MPFNYKKCKINTIINYLVVLYAFILPLSRSALSVLSVALIVLWFAEGNFKDKLTKINKTYMSIFALGFFMVISYLWSSDFQYAAFYVRKYWQYFLVSFVVFTSLKKENVIYVVSAFLLGMFVSELISYALFFDLIHKKNVNPHDPSPFMNHIEYSIYLSIASIILMDRILKLKGLNIRRIIYIALFLLTSVTLFITHGRTGQFIYILNMFIFICVYFGINAKNILKSVAVGLLVFAVVYGFSGSFRTKFDNFAIALKGSKYTNPCSSVGTRLNMIKVGSEIFISHPIAGVGVGDSNDEFKKIIHSKYPRLKCLLPYNHLHNQYIQIMAQVGIIGLILLLLIFYFFFRESKDKKLGFLFSLSIMLAFFGDVLFSRQFSIALISLFIALLLRYDNQEDYFPK